MAMPPTLITGVESGRASARFKRPPHRHSRDSPPATVLATPWIYQLGTAQSCAARIFWTACQAAPHEHDISELEDTRKFPDTVEKQRGARTHACRVGTSGLRIPGCGSVPGRAGRADAPSNEPDPSSFQ